jgi:hypothetical protein
MTDSEKKFQLYLTILRFLPFKITANFRRIYVDINLASSRVALTAYFNDYPSELDLELFDDIVTDSNAHLPDFFVEKNIQISKSSALLAKHEFLAFAVYEQ